MQNPQSKTPPSDGKPTRDPKLNNDFTGESSTAACTHALHWTLSGEEAHAIAAAILDAWSATLKSVTNHDARLLRTVQKWYQGVAASDLFNMDDSLFLNLPSMFDRRMERQRPSSHRTRLA